MDGPSFSLDIPVDVPEGVPVPPAMMSLPLSLVGKCGT